MATTVEAIRDNAISLIEALSPSLLSSVPMRRHRGEQSLDEWADANPAASLRVFSLLQTSDGEPPAVSNTTEELRTAILELRIAYPRLYGLYGQQNVRDAFDLMEADAIKIDGRSGIGLNNSGGYVAGCHSVLITDRIIEESESNLFAVFTIETMYYRGVSA